MNAEDLKKRTKNFAHRCVKLSSSLSENSLGCHIKKQLIRSSTSVAANYRAACMSQSKAGFVAKLSVVVEEIDETLFWIEFLTDENLVHKDKVQDLYEEAGELTAIFVASRKTSGPRNDLAKTN